MTKFKNPCRMVCKYNDEGLCMGCDRTMEEVKNWLEYNDQERNKVYDLIMERGANPYEKKRYDF
ncbi:MAG: DUF1289 domain-containing protein [Bacteroidota bacterium]